MATAYAALTSLTNLIKQIHEHPHPPILLDEEQFLSLSSKLNVFRKFLEIHHSSIDDELEGQLAKAALDTEDLIDNHLTDRIQDRVDLHRSLEKVMEDLDLMTMERNRQVNDATSGEKVVVGEEDIATKIMDKLTQQLESSMGGIAYELHKKQVDSLCSKIRFLRGILENRNTVDHVLEGRIADAVRNAEGCIETHIAGRVRHQEEFHSGLQRVIEDMDPIEKEVMKMNRLAKAARTVEDLIDTADRIQDQADLHRSLEKVMKDLDLMAMEMNPSEQSQGNDHPSATYGESVVIGEEGTATKILDKLTQQLESGMGEIAYEFHKKQVDSLCSKICYLRKILEDRKTVDHGLDSRIADTARNAEGTIDRKDHIDKEVMEMNRKAESQGNNQPTQQSVPLDSSQSQHHTDSDVSNLVGIKDITEKIMLKLTRPTKSDRQMITITGMGGIGKTTLALNVYEQPIIKEKFDKYRAWASVSRDYNIKDILVELLHCLDSQRSKEILGLDSEHKLRENLHKFLLNQKYLIVLDDVLDAEVWESLKRSVPATSGSGIVITTRLGTIANSIGSESEEMDLLDEGKSWELFRKNAFGQDTCSPELEEIGKTIANNCGGLPLSIVVIGGHLAKSSRTPKYWNYISGNLSEVVKSEDERCRKILSLSYARMPVHLKPCFLYMAVFPEGKVFGASRVIRLWVAEGFLKPIDNKSLEETAEEYLNDLVRRHLILSSTPFSKGKIKSCKMHDLLRDLCVEEALKKNFLCIVKKPDELEVLNNERRIVMHSNASKREYPTNIVDVVKSQAPLRTFIINGIIPLVENRLARVLAPTNELRSIRLPKFEAAHCTWNLRYVECMESIWDAYLRRAIFHPWNLQYLFIAPIFTEPQPDIWEMPQLRRIKTKYLFLSRPPSESNVVMKKLKSAKTIINFSFCEEVVKRIPSIKKLAVRYIEGLKGFEEGAHTLNNVKRLEHLESFRCFLDLKKEEPSRFLENLALPSSLKKLNIRSLHFDDVTAKIASLPLLEVLKLCDCSGSKWNLDEVEFPELKHLQLYDCCYLESFEVEREHFPHLESLVLVNLDCLKEISFGVGDTLKSMEVKFCPDEAVDCANDFADEQHDNGNEELEVTALVLKGSRFSKSELNAKYFRVETYHGSDGV